MEARRVDGAATAHGETSAVSAHSERAPAAAVGPGASATPARSPAGTAGGVWTVRALLAWTLPYLAERGVEQPRTIAEILLAHVLGVERLRLYMEPERPLATSELATLRDLVARAGRHEPVQHLVGRWPFLGRDFEVGPCTLIPRPATEVLVERGIAWCRERGARSVRALDLGTGTGCIAISLALGMRAVLRPEGLGCRPMRSEGVAAGVAAPNAAAPLPVLDLRGDLAPRPEPASSASAGATDPRGAASDAPARSITMVAVDVVPEAADLARRNAERLGVEIDVRVGDLYRAIALDEAPFDLIASNPPYVTDAEYAELDRNVAEYEPATALRGGADGLDLVRRVVAGAEPRLVAGGLLLVEIGWKHREAALGLIAGPCWRGAEVLRDQDGLDRVLVAHRTDVPWRRAH